MLLAHFNYPNSRVTIHGDQHCGRIQQMGKKGQRYVRVDLDSFGREIRRFVDQEHQFAAAREHNDMWLEVEFSNPAFELAVVDLVHSLLSDRYKRFKDTKPNIHCTQ